MKVQITYDDTLYQLVPKEATLEMHKAYRDVLSIGSELDAAMVYRSMLSAAPTPPAQPAIGWTDEEIEDMRKRGWEPAQCKICGEYAGARPAQPAEMPLTDTERAGWWALAMNAAASLEDAASCLRDNDAKKAAKGACEHVRQKCKRMWEEAAHGTKGES